MQKTTTGSRSRPASSREARARSQSSRAQSSPDAAHSHSAACADAPPAAELAPVKRASAPRPERLTRTREPWLAWSQEAEASLRTEFGRLAQRELGSSELEVARACLRGDDVWAQGFEPEAVPVLALALAALTPQPGRPFILLSHEAELLRARQIRFGARTACWLLDHEAPQESSRAARDALRAFAAGTRAEGGVICCTLESLRNPEIRDALAASRPLAFFVEAAHAVSPYAHELRPSLSLVPGARAACAGASLVAFTRAASTNVRVDAVARLGLDARFLSSVHSPLVPPRARLSVATGEAASKPELATLVQRLPRPTAVFCATPHEADEVYALLGAEQVPVHRYHGAMPTSDRATEMLHFALPGRRAVMVAVSAFQPGSGLAGVDAGPAATPEGLGLGFGRQKLRSLVHLCAPASLEQYAHELALLCDGDEPAEAVLFLSPASIKQTAATLEKARVTGLQLVSVAEALAVAQGTSSLTALERQSGVGRKVAQRAVRILADAGLVRLENAEAAAASQGHAPDTTVRASVSLADLEQATGLLVAALEELRERDGERLDALVAYAGGRGCRQKALLGRFAPDSAGSSSDAAADGCGTCDECRPERAPAQRRQTDAGALVLRRRAAAQAWSHEQATRTHDEDADFERALSPRRIAAGNALD